MGLATAARMDIHRQRQTRVGLVMPWNLYGLLYLDDEHNRHANIQGGSSRRSVEIYTSCASLLQSCCEYNEEDFVLLTNNSEKISDVCRDLGLPNLRVKDIRFTDIIPKGIPFYQAHHKLSVLSEFAGGDLGNNVALIDIDSIVGEHFSRRLPSDALGAYDITNDVPASYIESIKQLVGEQRPVRWYGGEFISGQPAAFARLSAKISELSGAYFDNISAFPHIGDETIVSAAINLLGHEGMEVVDLATSAIVKRWWSSNTMTAQSSFAESCKSSVIHLPSDKPLLADLAKIDGIAANVFRRYGDRVRHKVLVRRIANLVTRVISPKRSFPPRLT
jgi:hypothetical protein